MAVPVTDPTLQTNQTGLANTVAPETTPVTQPALPPPAPVGPVSTFTAAQGAPGVSTSTGYDPTAYAVPEKGLVQNQIKSIVENDSPLMQQARVRAMQTMNERGLVNSTLNTEAGQNAVITQALPIATQDAASIRDAAFKTAEAQNTASQFGAAAANTASSTNAQLTTSMNTTNANAINNALAANAQAENVRNLSLIDNNTKQALAVLDVQSRQILQTNANAASMFQETVKNIAAISVNDTMTRQAKDSAIASQLNLLNQGLQTAAKIGGTLPSEVGGLNLEEYFQTTTNSADFTPAQRQSRLVSLESEISNQKRRIRELGQGIGVPLLTGPDASERRKPIWDQMIAEANAALKRLNDEKKRLSTA